MKFACKRIHDWARSEFLDPRNHLFVGKSQPFHIFCVVKRAKKPQDSQKSEQHDFIAQLQLVESRTLDHTFGDLDGTFLRHIESAGR